jgi:hypothetical protein
VHLSKSAVLWIPQLVLLLLFGVELWAITVINGGRFIYTLDDPYIHLALAENIARGHYGVNLGEFSAPSSSIIWPFLLAPFSNLSIAADIPLAINLVASLGSVYLFGRLLVRTVARSKAPNRFLIVCILAVLLIPTTNVVGLLFTGMEHSLQVFLALLMLLGIVREQETGSVPWWLAAAIVLGPLVRYENLALAVPALAYLAVRRHHRALLLCAGALTATMVGFSFFLHSKHLGLLPTSVLAKSSVAWGDGRLRAVAGNLTQNLRARQGALLSLGLLLLVAVAFDPRRTREDRLLASWCAMALLLHLLVGTFGWYSRYEIYIWTTVVLTLLYLFGEQLVRRLDGVPLPKVVAGLSLSAVAVGLPYASTLITTPLASRDIYDQQYQMHRFITEYWRGPVAVNDLGWTSYRNDAYVLDLWGLASGEALKALREDTNPDWMDVLARRHEVRLAMIHHDAFEELPNGWIPFGELRLEAIQITPISNTVTFYALSTEALGRARALALDYQKTLPRGAAFVLYDRP